MKTRFGKTVDLNNPLSEYPTPQFARKSFLSMNGLWEFQVSDTDAFPPAYTERIVVPFAPETELSGLRRSINKGEWLHYRKSFTIPPDFKGGRTLIHFEAVDQVADVYLNGVKIIHHEGGYLPFTADCMELVKGENILQVVVYDDPDNDVYPRGKQMRNPDGIWYTPTSGIWGSVWLEHVPNQVIQKIRIDPQFDKKSVVLQAFFEGKAVNAIVKLSYDGFFICSKKMDEKLMVEFDLSNNFHPWSPESPNLYEIEICINDDAVTSYFAMRKFSIVEWKGKKVFGLNNKPYFLNGVLDQGYWPESGLTPPSDEAMIFDIQAMKELGFNMLRKHIKVEPMRWYYHCDRLGMIVIQDFLNAGRKYKQFLIYTCPFVRWKIDDTKEKKMAYLGRGNPQSREYFEKEMPVFIDRLYNVPSIAIWTLFNEGWGQFESSRLTEKLRLLDNSRLIDSASGWFDQGAGDFNSRHIYFRQPKAEGDGKRVLAVTEYGGYVSSVEGHRSGTGKGIHYEKAKDKDSLNKRYSYALEHTLAPMIESDGLSCVVYTQLSDVEEEENGLYTYDREVCKANKKTIIDANMLLRFKND